MRPRSRLLSGFSASFIALILVIPSAVSRVHPDTPAVAASLPPPVQLTAEQDRRRTLDLLQIASLRPGADTRNPNLPNAVNYDESRANPYPNLPDPLILNNGRKVTSAKMWWKLRRPQIAEYFDQNVYGRVPAHVPAVRWEVASSLQEKVGEVAVITKHLIGHVDNSSYPAITVDIPLTLTTPAAATGPVPVIMQFTYDPKVMAALRARFAAAGPPPAPFPGPTWQEQVLAKGWGYATLIPTDVQADNGVGLTAGIIGLVNKGQPRKPDDWGALRAWAWGASRALDYFATDKAVDAGKVGLEGHSRYGKAILVAMAYDQRFAIAYVSSSGAGGAKLYRRDWGERVENVAGSSEYHWMAGNFLRYAGPLNASDMPVDAHELIAMCAPRPVFISAGSSPVGDGTDAAKMLDGWVDAKGMFMAAAAAGPVYKLLRKKDLGTTSFPPMDTTLIDGDIAFRQHHYGHTDAPNWPSFLSFAGRYLGEPAHPATAQN
jgi:hypothetical protein